MASGELRLEHARQKHPSWRVGAAVGARRYGRGMTTSANNAAIWATGAANTFREVARTTENPTTKLLAEGLTQLAEAVRALDAAPRPQ